MQLSPAQTRVAHMLAEPGPSGGRRTQDLAAEFHCNHSTMHSHLHGLMRRGVAVLSQGGYRLAENVLVSRKGQVYRQLWLLPDEEDPAA